MLDINLKQVVNHYDSELIEQTRAFEKEAPQGPFLKAIYNRWGIVQDHDHLTHLRMDNDTKNGRFLAHNILFQEVMKEESEFKQDYFIEFTTYFLTEALKLREGPNNRTLSGMYKSEDFTPSLTKQVNMNEKDLRYLISTIRANAVLVAKDNPDVMKNFLQCQKEYVRDYKNQEKQRRNIYAITDIAEWYNRLSTGRRSTGGFFPYELEFLLQATSSNTKGILDITKFYMESFIYETVSAEKIAENIRQQTGVTVNNTTLSVYLDYISMDFPKEFIAPQASTTLKRKNDWSTNK